MGSRGPKPRDPEARFAEKVRPGAGCWDWLGTQNGVGYGLFYLAPGKVVLAHRWSYEFWNGAIPEGLQIDHLCRNRACVNPRHLEAVTPSENTLRGMAIRYADSQTPQNVRELNRAKSARYRARKKAAA